MTLRDEYNDEAYRILSVDKSLLLNDKGTDVSIIISDAEAIYQYIKNAPVPKTED